MSENQGAIKAYSENAPGERERRDRLVEEYLPLVHHVLGRLLIHLPATLDREDLYAVGVLGLMHAAETFDPTKGAIFKTHAYTNIRGAILDELRKHDVVPRSRRDRLRQVSDAEQRLADHLDRPPTPEEIAEEAGLTLDQVENILVHAHGMSVLSLEDEAPIKGEAAARLVDCLRMPGSPDPAKAAEMRELKQRLAQAIQELPDRERRVVVLYYAEGLRLKEIGQVLEVTESRVSQLHSRALYRLNRALKIPTGRGSE